jgi:hypothetical protein
MLEFIEYLHKGPMKRFNAKPGFRLYLISGNVELGSHKSFHVGVFLGIFFGYSWNTTSLLYVFGVSEDGVSR